MNSFEVCKAIPDEKRLDNTKVKEKVTKQTE